MKFFVSCLGLSKSDSTGMSREITSRVKVYTFTDGNAWDGVGTGILSKDYIEVAGGEILTITVRSENDNSVIIQSQVQPEGQYTLQEVG